MQRKDETILGYRKESSPGLDPTYTPAVLYTNRVTPSGSVIGDFVHPNPWNYNIDYCYYPNGEVYREDAEYDPYTGQVVNWHETYRISDCLSGSDSIPELMSPRYDEAYNAALSKLNGYVRGGLNLAVDLAEGGQTRTMLASAAQLLYGGLRRVANPALAVADAGDFAFRRLYAPVRRINGTIKLGKRQSAGTPLTRWSKDFSQRSYEVANRYLEYKYGWAPLMNSLYEAAEESVRIVLNRRQTFKARATFRDREQFPFESLVGGFPARIMRDAEGKTSCTISVTMSIPGGFDWARWTSLNPLTIGYELVPFSFVLDWVYDIGSMLRDFETACHYRSFFESGYVSKLFAVEATEKAIPAGFVYVSDIRRSRVLRRTSYRKHVNFTRDLLSNYPLPRPPVLKLDLSSGQLLTSVALLRQRLRAV